LDCNSSWWKLSSDGTMIPTERFSLAEA